VIVVAWAMWLMTRPTQRDVYPVSWRSTLPLLALYASLSGPLNRHLPSAVTFVVIAVSLIIALLFDLKRVWLLAPSQRPGQLFRA
jgi:hypothetical protein